MDPAQMKDGLYLVLYDVRNPFTEDTLYVFCLLKARSQTQLSDSPTKSLHL